MNIDEFLDQPAQTKADVPGFHDYHSNLMECLSWIDQETARQKDFWDTKLKPKVERIDLGAEIHQIRADLSQIFNDRTRLTAQLAAAKSETDKVIPVYQLLRLLLKQGAILQAIEEHYDGMFAFYTPV